MKICRSISLVLILIAPFTALHSQEKPVYIIVHGAWAGSWAFQEVDELLTAQGCTVYRPCLTGLGERHHLASLEINLTTHILDVINTIIFEELEQVVLVGHSYGGMVITGVADSIPERIRRVIYLDAGVPENGESMMEVMGRSREGLLRSAENGFLIPDWLKAKGNSTRERPHPVKTVTEPLKLSGRGQALPTTYILTVDEGKQPEEDAFYRSSERARSYGWEVVYLTAGHNAMWEVPEELVEMLYERR